MRYHYSGLSLFNDCGLAFYYRYIENKTTPRDYSMIVGTAVDAAVNADLLSKMRTGSPLWTNDIEDIVTGRMKEQLAPGDVYARPNAKGWMSDRNSSMSAAIEMAIFYHNEVTPKLSPKYVQRYWEVTVNGATLCGYIDVQENGKVRDTKTSCKSPDSRSANDSRQLTMYAMAVWLLDGDMPESVHLDYVVRTPIRGDNKLVQLSSSRTQKDFDDLSDWISDSTSRIESGSFMPAPDGHWMCRSGWCGYYESCPSGRARTVLA